MCVINKLEKKVPSEITINQCRFCKRIKEGKTFSRMSNQALARAIKVSYKLPCDVKAVHHTGKDIDVIFVFDVEGERVSFPRNLPYKVSHETCQRCYRISSGYYEAVVQLRGDLYRINNLIAKITKYVKRRGGFIAKIDDVDGGRDVYVSDKLMMNEFFKDYELKPVRSFRLYGMKRGKKLYRNTYSLHLAPVYPNNRFQK